MTDNTAVLTKYGDDVTFTINVTNQGSITSNGFTFNRLHAFRLCVQCKVIIQIGTRCWCKAVSSEVLVPGETVIYNT
ncbi:MAG: hypothetical protein IPO26_14015 [Saprospiraceae bacterium]|nr:hypothetical protein [Saprospiraceae bacterium]